MIHIVKTPKEIAAIFGCTEQQARQQLISNAADMMISATKAQKTKNGKYRGYTQDQWQERANKFAIAATK